MGVAEVAAQLAMRQKDDNQKAMDDLSNMVKMERVKKLGKKLMAAGDYSPEGLMRFAQTEGVQIDEMQPLVQLVGQFQKMQARESTPNRFAESERGILNQQTGEFAAHGPQTAAPSSPFAKLLKDKDLYQEGTPERTAIEQQIAKQNEPGSSGQPSTLGKLISEMESIPDGDPRREIYQQRIAKEAAQTGMKISVGADGEVTVLTNADQNAPGPALTKAVASQVQKDVLDLNDQMGKLTQIKKSFKPEYQEIDTRLKNMKTSWGSKLGLNIPEEDKAQLKDFSEYKRKTISNINSQIKYLTGTAMSEKEADRIMKGIPNPGSGIFDGDSPIDFKAKLDGTISEVKRSLARAKYVNKNGLKSFDSIPLDGVDSLIDRRGNEIEQALKKQFPGEDVSEKVNAQLKSEFGMDF